MALDGSEVEICNQVKLAFKGDPEISIFLPILNDQLLLAFVRGRKYKLEQVISTIRKYYNVRKKFPEIFMDLLPSKVTVDLKIFGILRHEDEMSRPTMLISLRYWNPDQYELNGLLQQAILLMDLILRRNESAQKNGINLVMDVGGLSLYQCRHITPFVVQKVVNIFWGAFPLQYKEAHIINSPWCFTMLMSMIRSFLPKKFNQRLRLHTTGYLRKFHRRYDPSILPSDLGGTLVDEEKCFKTREYVETLNELEPFYQDFKRILD